MLACYKISRIKAIHKSIISVRSSANIKVNAALRFRLITIMLFSSFVVFANKQQAGDHNKVLVERSAKIVNTLNISDSIKYNKVLNVLVNQYEQLNIIHDQSKANIAGIRKQTLSEEEKDSAIKIQEENKSSALLKLHNQFIARMQTELTIEQIEKVKDGMTYRVFPITYAAYQDMILNLTTVQKEKIYNWLKEARELAMDEGSSDDKHKVFGKYKGRINNYLSAEGYDLKVAQKEWQERIKKRNEGNSGNS